MVRWFLVLLLSLLLLLCCLSASPVEANPIPDGGVGPDGRGVDAASDAARQLFVAGKTHFVAGQFRAAQARFVEAYRLQPLPDILFMIGQCHRNLGRHRRAIQAFEGYLRDQPAALDRVQVERLIQTLEQREREQAAHRTAALLVQQQPACPKASSTAREPPLYRRWWFWTLIAGAAAALGGGIAIGHSLAGPERPSGSLGTLDLR